MGGSFAAAAEDGAPRYVDGDTKAFTLGGDAQFQDVMACVDLVAGPSTITSATSLHAAVRAFPHPRARAHARTHDLSCLKRAAMGNGIYRCRQASDCAIFVVSEQHEMRM